MKETPQTDHVDYKTIVEQQVFLATDIMTKS
jgi:hypothetical protein